MGFQWGRIRRLLFSRSQMERDVQQELEFHIRGRVEELVEEGWEPEEARAEVLRHFGDLERIRDECRSISRERMRKERRGEVMGTLVRDLRFGLRTLRKNPVFTTVALLTLGLGIGATTAVFSVVDSVLLRPLPYRNPDRLVMVWETNPGRDVVRDNPSPPNYADWRRLNRTLTEMATWGHGSVTLSAMDPPEVADAFFVSPHLFETLGLGARVGRVFTGEDVRTDSAVLAVMGHGLWQRLFGGDPDVVGRTLRVNGVPVEVVGVLEPGTAVPGFEPDLWLPRDYTASGFHRQTRGYFVVGRLDDGVTREQAEEDLNRVAADLEARYPESNQGWRVSLVPLHEEVVGQARTLLLVLFGAVGLVLLIACVNVANLLLGRAASRGRELAIRRALGASRGRLRSQLLTESVLLGLLGGVLGFFLAHRAVDLLVALEPGDLPRIGEIAVDYRVLAFAALASVATGLLFGLAPALGAAAGDPGNTLDGSATRRLRGGGGGARIRKTLIAGEVALSLVLLAGAGLLVRSFLDLRSTDPGFDAEGVLTAKVSLSGPAYRGNEAKARYFRDLARRLEAVPGVTGAAVTSTLPTDPTGIDFGIPYHAEGQPRIPEGEAPETDYRIVSPGYVEGLEIPLLRGRTFSDADRADGRRVVMVNEAFVRRHWPGQDPLGKVVTLFYVENAGWEVVGVVGDTRHQGLADEPRPQVFVPLAQAEVLFGYMSVVVKTLPGAPPDLADRVRRAAAEIDREEPLHDLRPLEGWVAASLARDRFVAAVLGAFALMALVLAAAGIYGVISYQVARRTREIGLRMALGAGRTGVLKMVVGDALLLTLAGLGIGLAGALASGRVLSGFLFGVGPHDPPTYAAVSALLLLVALAAAWVPAYRAARVDPVEALRSD